MRFLSKIEALRISEDGKVDMRDVYTSDADFKKLAQSIAKLVENFSAKFNLHEDELHGLLFNQVEDELKRRKVFNYVDQLTNARR